MKILPLIIGLGALYAITKSDTKKQQVQQANLLCNKH